ncbi:bZIP transcription factor, bZIP-1 [Ascosphaera apis ARSEF 7405]|uniref:BZIP transcription factor, bZIP-1 n=1 Tax=Ascosphaera apis ARSEF 7405 TaxID=392613 RepID=A0A162IEJ7_9EURO|nr:bZIP transcription factor, bZIP-1 [Ascosphaera apis ARSEF 7405]
MSAIVFATVSFYQPARQRMHSFEPGSPTGRPFPTCVPQDHFSRTPVTASTATTATTSATATATTATTATTASGFVSEPSSTYLNPASAFSTSTVDDLYLNSFPALSHTLSSDKAVSAVDTLSSTSSHQPSPDTFTNYKKDFHLDPGQFHSGVDYFGDLIQSDSHAGSASANAGHQVYHDPFAFDPMSWEFDINHALEAAFLTQAPPYPSLVATVAGESGDGSASSNGVVGGGHAGTVNSHVNVNPINRSANIDGNTSSSPKTLSISSTSSTSTTKPRTTKRFSPNSVPVSTDTQSSKRRKRTVATASSTSPTVSHSSNATDSPTATASASASAPADASVSPPSTAADSAAEKRRRNTLAARRCRQRQLDRVAALESALEEALKERDDARVEIARLKGENEVLRSLIGPGKR